MERNEIHIIYGDNPEQMVKKVLETLHIENEIGKDMVIGIKPNLINTRPAEQGGTTSPDLVAGIIDYLQREMFKNIIIIEGSWAGADTQKAFANCGYLELSEKYDVPLYDLKADTYREIEVKDLKLKVCEKPLNVDYLINVPVLKAHCQTRLTCALKNLKGCIPDSEKRRYHTLGLHKPIAYLNYALRPDLIIVDAIQGDLSFEEGGCPVQMNRILVGKDPVLIDSYGASLIGYGKDEIDYIGIAESIEIGSSDLDSALITEYETDLKNNTSFQHTSRAALLAEKIEAREACSACYGSLIHALQRLKDKGKFYQIDRIYIGQGFRGEEIEGTGIGSCTAGVEKNLPGCPPAAKDIYDFLLGL